MKTTKAVRDAIKLLKDRGYGITEPEPESNRESEYWKAIRTGVRPAIWPPIMMDSDELEHFRRCHS